MGFYSRWGPCVLVSCLILAAIPGLAQTPDPFQSNPGPDTPKPAPRPRPAPEPAVPPASPTPTPTGVAVFDGTYKGGAPATSQCPATSTEIDVSQGRVSGIGDNAISYGRFTPGRPWRVEGTVTADGSFSGLTGNRVLVGRFQNGTFQGSWMASAPECGRRLLTLQRISPR